ncbi:MAG: YigZ family protein [Oscillospiraceae bacterium]|jgi:uncharacterized YigZ family protein|nr:YigZ family protein [Oscillospiraceae bacterium]
MSESFRTLASEASGVYTEKKSVFTGIGRSANSQEDALAFVQNMKKRFPEARHVAYAFIIDDNLFRVSDAGEPSGTAGKPILEMLKRHNLTRCVIAVARDFGGTLLGAGGLTRAYGQAAKLAVDACGIAVMERTNRVSFRVPYPLWDTIRHRLSLLPCEIADTQYTDAVSAAVRVRASDAEQIAVMLSEASAGQIKANIVSVQFEAW